MTQSLTQIKKELTDSSIKWRGQGWARRAKTFIKIEVSDADDADGATPVASASSGSVSSLDPSGPSLPLSDIDNLPTCWEGVIDPALLL